MSNLKWGMVHFSYIYYDISFNKGYHKFYILLFIDNEKILISIPKRGNHQSLISIYNQHLKYFSFRNDW